MLILFQSSNFALTFRQKLTHLMLITDVIDIKVLLGHELPQQHQTGWWTVIFRAVCPYSVEAFFYSKPHSFLAPSQTRFLARAIISKKAFSELYLCQSYAIALYCMTQTTSLFIAEYSLSPSK